MAEINIVERRVVPNKPKVIANEQIEVYIPLTDGTQPGVASYSADDFVVENGKVSLLYSQSYYMSYINTFWNDLYGKNGTSSAPTANGIKQRTSDLETKTSSMQQSITDMQMVNKNQSSAITNHELQIGYFNEYLDHYKANGLNIRIDENNYVMTVDLLDADGNTINSAELDLPLEQTIVNGHYDENDKALILTLISGEIIEIPVGSLIRGLVSQKDFNDLVNSVVQLTDSAYCIYGTNANGDPATFNWSTGAVPNAIARLDDMARLTTSTPSRNTHAANKAYVDDAFYEAQKQIDDVETTANLAMQILYQSSIVYNPTTEDTYNERITAEGLNVVDGSEAVLQKVVGSTVRCENLLNIETVAKNNGTDYLNDGNAITYRGNVGSGAYSYDTGQIMFPNASVSSIEENGIYLQKDKTYTISFDFLLREKGAYDEHIRILVYDYNLNVIKQIDGVKGIIGSSVLKKYSFTASKDGKISITFRINNNYVTLSNIQVREGDYTNTELPPYQPYFTGLKSASFAGIESGGRNLINVPEKFIITETSQFKVGHLSEGQYTISCDDFVAGGENSPTIALFVNGEVDRYFEAKDKKITFNLRGGDYTAYCYSNGFNHSASQGITSIVNKLMLNHGSTAELFTPYIEPTVFNFPKTPTPMGTTIDFENKKIVEGSREIVLDGTEDWVLSSTMDGTKKRFIINLLVSDPAIKEQYTILCKSSVYPSTTEGKTYECVNGVAVWGTNVYIYDEAYATKTVEEFKAHLAELYASGNPVVVRYLLATPTERDFTDEEKAKGKKYLVQALGTEKVIENDGKEYGANNTLTQNYIAIKE